VEPLLNVAAATALLFGIQLTGICILSMDTLCHYIFGIPLRVARVGGPTVKSGISSAKSTKQNTTCDKNVF